MGSAAELTAEPPGEGMGPNGLSLAVLTTAEREELRRLRRDLCQVKLEREILAKATAWFAREPRLDPVRRFEFAKAHQGRLSDCHAVLDLNGEVATPRRPRPCLGKRSFARCRGPYTGWEA